MLDGVIAAFLAAALPALAEVRGAAFAGRHLFTWGPELQVWSVPELRAKTLARGDFQEGGCLLDADGDGRLDIVLQDGHGLGRLVVLRAPAYREEKIDEQIEMHDCMGATLFGRRGVLMVQRGMQVRFYERHEGKWSYREIYSFYTASFQGGLLTRDIDADGREDIVCGNYWIRSPERFEQSWRLFAINLWHETPLSANMRFLWWRGGLLVSQGEMERGRLAWFRPPSDPKLMWDEQCWDTELNMPHAIAARDGNVLVATAEGVRVYRDGQLIDKLGSVDVRFLWVLGDGSVAAVRSTGPQAIAYPRK